jgi:GH18 family chitinase
MRKKLLLCSSTLLLITFAFSQPNIIQVKSPGEFPIKAMSISLPPAPQVDSFVTLINNELAPRQINTLLLRVDYHYQYKSHPELIDEGALSEADVNKIVTACQQNNIKIVPQINLFGHQSWAGKIGKLLEKYPEFDETPWIKLDPDTYKWPNPDSLYCKSYCPLHPDVHKVVFELVDEICDVFQTNAFHAGMDEIFYIGMDKCPRCSGKNKAELFANEVNKVRDHLAEKNRTLYIWADRLINGFETGLGGWEASFNYTWPAIEMVKKDVVMCDWHYERPDKTAAYFATHGFKVITCTWNRPAVAVEQYKDMQKFYAESTPEMSVNFLGMMQTVWSGPNRFFFEYYNTSNDTARRSAGKAFRDAFKKVDVTKYKDDKDFPIVAYTVCKTPDQIAGINFAGITHLNYAFFNPDSSGNFAYNACLDSLVKVAHKNGVKVFASIGGGSAPAYYSKLLKDNNRTKLVSKLARLAIDYNLDGIDVDLEGDRIDENYEKFVIELANALKPSNKMMTAAIATVYKDQFTDKALSQFDYVTIMTYDKTGPWRPEQAGPHSPYSMAVEDLDYWANTRKLDKKKMFLGLPFYGYSFGPNGASSMSYKDIVSKFPKSEKKDELKMPDGSRLYYNGIPTIQKKVQLAKKNAGGVMFWHIGGDAEGDKSLVGVINKEAAKH